MKSPETKKGKSDENHEERKKKHFKIEKNYLWQHRLVEVKDL